MLTDKYAFCIDRLVMWHFACGGWPDTRTREIRSMPEGCMYRSISLPIAVFVGVDKVVVFLFFFFFGSYARHVWGLLRGS